MLIAQCRQAIIFKTDSNHLKLVSQLYDSCQETFFHYCDFLQTAFDVDEYAAMLPSLETLVHEYGLEPGAAFMSTDRFFDDSNRDRRPPRTTRPRTETPPSRSTSAGKRCRGANSLRVVRGMLPDEVWGAISPELYLTFWSLSLYDLHVPTARYDAEIDRRRKEIEVLEGPHQNQRGGDGNGSARGRRRRGGGKNASGWRRWWIRSSESATRRSARWRGVVSKRLAREKDRFLADLPRRNETAAAIAQHCVLPRASSRTRTPACARFVERLNALDTPWFSFIDVLQPDF